MVLPLAPKNDSKILFYSPEVFELPVIPLIAKYNP